MTKRSSPDIEPNRQQSAAASIIPVYTAQYQKKTLYKPPAM